MDVVSDIRFKEYSKLQLGICMSGHVADECAKATVAITDHMVRTTMNATNKSLLRCGKGS